MTPLIAHEFVIPHLSEFQVSHPDVNIAVESSMDMLDFDDAQIDAAIRVGNGQWEGLTVLPLCECQAVILAAPSLLAQLPICTPQDLAKHTLIRRQQEQFGWEDLTQQLFLSDISSQRTLTVDTDLAALHAAERGLGIALSFLPANLTTSQLWPDSRFSVVLTPVATPLIVCLVFPPNHPQRDLLHDIFRWLKGVLNRHD
ncbi:LysR substrate-binding domain-containing protein [Serratia marcescens]|uniref:LysR substrate-binding domain-containing protein n=1 Tax=Serratia marcescens TaxID=615 RepID=UPI003EE2AEA6